MRKLRNLSNSINITEKVKHMYIYINVEIHYKWKDNGIHMESVKKHEIIFF